MSIAEAERGFLTPDAAVPAATPNLLGARTSLSRAAAEVAATLKRRVVTAGILSAFARLADFTALAAVSSAIFLTYVAPVEGVDTRYVLASLVLPAATIILIGSLGLYTVAAYQQVLLMISRAAAI